MSMLSPHIGLLRLPVTLALAAGAALAGSHAPTLPASLEAAISGARALPQEPAVQEPAVQQPAPTTRPEDPQKPAPESWTSPPPSYGSLDLGFAETGISFGNSKRWNGIRLNLRDHAAEAVNGLNITFWSPRDRGIDEFVGLAFGVAPAAGNSTGVRLGLAATVAAESATGIELAGLATVSEGATSAIRIAGIAAVSEGDADGIGLAGMALVSEGHARGLHLAGIAAVAQRGFTGIQLAGISTVAEQSMTGIQAAGIATVSEGDMDGLSFGGIAVVSEGGMHGLHAAGLATVAQGNMHGIGISGLATVSEQRIAGIHGAGIGVIAEHGVHGIGIAGIAVTDPHVDIWDFEPRHAEVEGKQGSWNRGLMLAGLRADAARVEGITIAGLINRSCDFDGIGVSLHNSVSGLQRGVQVGLFNYAEDLRGVQFGLLNHVPSNPWYLRWLPLVNCRF